MRSVFQKSKVFKEDLLSFNREPLTGLSVVLLIVLDLFIVYNMGLGIEGETAKAPSPSHYHPRYCSSHFAGPKTRYTDFEHRGREYLIRRSVSPYCLELDRKLAVFTGTEAFAVNLSQVKALDAREAKNSRRIAAISKNYNTRLFERMASMENNAELRRAKKEYDALNADNAKIAKERAAIAPVASLPGYGAYRDYVTETGAAYDAEKAAYAFWQPFKEFGYMLRFVLPVLLLFGMLYYRGKVRELRGEPYNPVVKIISAHLSLIFVLPVVYYTLSLVYHVIPKTLLKQLIEQLVAMGLLSLLNYAAIAAVVLLFGLLIYWIQKRTVQHRKAERVKNYKKIIAFSDCFECGYRVDYTRPYCPYCGTKLHEPCPKCGSMKIRHLPFCDQCGAKAEG
jgi:hypothetical protein